MDAVYNYLNLPERIEFDDCKTIEFTYDANGNKLRKELKNGAMLLSTHDYLGSIEYKGSELEAIYHEEGRVYYEDSIGRYEFNIRDHLGNTRLTFTDKDGDGVIEISDDPEISEVLQENHYYPFGMNMDGQWMANAGREDKYQYNGKELHDDFGLGWYAYGARFYDPAIGRFPSVDPLAEEPHNITMTPYHFVANNPISNIDPDGLDWYRSQDGEAVWFDSADNTYTDNDGNEYNRIGEYYIMEGKNGYLIHRQNEVVAEVNQVSEGIAGQGIDGKDLLHSGDFYFSKQELFNWGLSNDNINNWIFGNAPLELQKEYASFARSNDLSEAALPIALTIGAPVALIAGAELAVGVGVASEAIGPLRNWVRFGVSRHQGNRYYGMRWGAGREKYLKEIGSKRLQELNKRLRKQGGGHWDWWKLK